MTCCQKECTKTIINHEVALKKWKAVQAMSKENKNMLLLGTLNALVQKDKTHRGEIRQKLASEYRFEGDHICLQAFQLIYDISEHKWKTTRKHFLEYNIVPIGHGLKTRYSNNKISFITILHVLKFIINYANIHGLPSPGIIIYCYILN